jgi:hypothetical protein
VRVPTIHTTIRTSDTASGADRDLSCKTYRRHLTPRANGVDASPSFWACVLKPCSSSPTLLVWPASTRMVCSPHFFPPRPTPSTLCHPCAPAHPVSAVFVSKTWIKYRSGTHGSDFFCFFFMGKYCFRGLDSSDCHIFKCSRQVDRERHLCDGLNVCCKWV